LGNSWEKVGRQSWGTNWKICVFPMKTHTLVGQFFPTVSQLFPNFFPNPCKDSYKDPTRILQEPRKDPTRIYKDLWDFVGSSGFLVGLLAEFLGNPWIPCGIPCGIWLFIRTQICNISGSLRVVDRRGSQQGQRTYGDRWQPEGASGRLKTRAAALTVNFYITIFEFRQAFLNMPPAKYKKSK
jgi:hypothetical protein